MAKELLKKKKEVMDMTTRPLLKKIILFSIPLVLTGILQLLYNAADIIIVGNFAEDGKIGMAAVGSTGSLVNLVTNLLIGLSIGALSAMSRCIGAGDSERADKIVHTAIPISLIGGVIVGIVGFFSANWMLTLMKTPPTVIGQATDYLQIYFIGMPFCMLYNFGASILRACGDTKKPLIILFFAGIINCGLNYAMVAWVQLGAKGVAIGTTVSQFISAVSVMILLMRRKGYGHFSIKKMCLHGGSIKEIFKIGLPAGIQSTIFSISNVIIQSSINGFGDVAMAGNAAASNLEMFVYISMNAIAQASLAFTSQNYGAKNIKNIRLVLVQCLVIVTVLGTVMGLSVFLLGEYLLKLYNGDLEVIEFGIRRLSVIATTYALCGIMEVLVGSLRGMGRSTIPMIVTVFGVCGIRLIWVYTAFALNKTLTMLYISYPISWLVTLLLHFVSFALVNRKVSKQFKEIESKAIMIKANIDSMNKSIENSVQ